MIKNIKLDKATENRYEKKNVKIKLNQRWKHYLFTFIIH